MRKKIIAVSIGALLLMVSAGIGAYAATKTTLIVNGKTANADVKVINGVTYLPLKAIAELLGAKVEYEAATKTVKVTGQTQTQQQKPEQKPVPTIGFSKNNPAPLGTEVIFTKREYPNELTGSVVLEEVVRGADAYSMLLQENQYNEPAPTGYEYLLVKINYKVISNTNPDSSVYISPIDFTLVAEGKDQSYASAVTPIEFRANLYAGASHSGWIAYLVKTTDSTPLIAYSREGDGTGGIWIKP